MQPSPKQKKGKKLKENHYEEYYSISAHEALVTMGSTGQKTGNVFGK